MTVRIYQSSDASAPVLTGTAGSLITVLDACLVDGYGTKTAAGWTKPYSGTNIAVYRMSTAGGSSGCYMRVDDTGTLTDARDARVYGYKTMSDINTGTAQFPTTATEIQVGGAPWKKSSTANATARPWVIIADERLLYFFSYANSTTLYASTTNNSAACFGDLISFLAGDTNQCILIGQQFTASIDGERQAMGRVYANYAADQPMWLARDYTGITQAKKAVLYPRCPAGLTGVSDGLTLGYSQSGAFPDPVTGGINLWSIAVREATATNRGLMPGFYWPFGGTLVGTDGDTFAGTGNQAGRNFILLPVQNYGGTGGRAAFQYDGDWRA